MPVPWRTELRFVVPPLQGQRLILRPIPLPKYAEFTEDVARGTGGCPPSTGVGAVANDSSRVLEELYGELRAMADRLIRDQSHESVLQATALANETFLKLAGGESLEGADRRQILALASVAMRNLLVDRARTKNRMKRSPHGKRVSFEEVSLAYEDRAVNLVALHEALERLGRFDPELARAVDLRFFGGLSMEETAKFLEVPLRSLERRWEITRRWLIEEMA